MKLETKFRMKGLHGPFQVEMKKAKSIIHSKAICYKAKRMNKNYQIIISLIDTGRRRKHL